MRKRLTISFLLIPLLLMPRAVSSVTLASTSLLIENSNPQQPCKAQPCYTNQLIHQHSPYLLQHAHNPINWMTWSDAALSLAKKENKPIFLSIGYSACHWCHVMERESFNNEHIAALLNQHYIAIKVDREQHPDIDEFYANAVMHFQGIQGWPMSLFLTPDGKAFYGGGYYTREQFENVLITQKNRWQNQQADVIKASQVLLQKLQTKTSTTQQVMRLDDTIRNQAIKELLAMQDADYGGFGEASKFPREYWLWLLLDQSRELPTPDLAFSALNNTLTHIARGGIHDHLAGGFFRYTTDQFWRVPHFEKMLYSQALLSLLYLQAANIQPNAEYHQIADKTLNFMLHNLLAPEGGFYTSLNANTVDGEGYYYIWTQDQIHNSLTTIDASIATDYYHIDKHGEMDDGGNILYTELSLQTTSDNINNINQKLLAARNRRTPPAVDKKIIMSWNSMAIIALTEGTDNLNNPAYLKQAQHTANFIWNKMQDEQGFYRTFINGQRELPAQLEDYAWYLNALIKLYDSDENPLWLQRAEIIANTIDVEFTDKDQGGLFQTAKSQANYLPLRPKSGVDKTLPSATAIASQAMIRLTRRTGNQRYRLIAENILASFAADAVKNPLAHATLLLASREYHQQPNQLPIYAARGNIRVHAQMSALTDNTYKLRIEIKMHDDWHINAQLPLDKNLIGTQLQINTASSWTLLDTQYPQPKLTTLGFSAELLALYTNTVVIHAVLRQHKIELNPLLQIQLQACNDQLCLPAEQLQFSPVLH